MSINNIYYEKVKQMKKKSIMSVIKLIWQIVIVILVNVLMIVIISENRII